MANNVNVEKVIDQFYQLLSVREKKMHDFYNGARPFLVNTYIPSDMWGRCNSIEEIYDNNIKYMERAVNYKFTDDMPYLEPWIGTGVYATAFGCQYMWREDNAPDTHYRYHKIEELKNLEYPDWRKSPIMQMVLDCIDYMKDKTKGKLPIGCTDTQSPYDTATLVLDASEFFAACYIDPETVTHFMDILTRLVIDFSNEQIKHIGNCFVQPGHIMPSLVGYKGLSISDDNLAVSSPDVNELFSLPCNQRIADAFGGLAIHSCGNWSHTMPMLRNMNNILMIDCAIGKNCDPSPNKATDVRDALRGSNIIVKARVGGDMEEIEQILTDLVVPDLRLSVQMDLVEGKEEEMYKRINEILNKLYKM